MVLEDLDVRLGAHRLAERADDLAPGGVGGVQDAPLGVAALLAEVVLAVLRVAAAVEVRPERDQVAHAVRSLAHDDLDDVAVAEAVAGDERVVDVGLEGVVGAPDRGDAALGVLARALGQPVLGDQHDAARLGAAERAREAGDSAAQDEKVALDRHDS